MKVPQILASTAVVNTGKFLGLCAGVLVGLSVALGTLSDYQNPGQEDDNRESLKQQSYVPQISKGRCLAVDPEMKRPVIVHSSKRSALSDAARMVFTFSSPEVGMHNLGSVPHYIEGPCAIFSQSAQVFRSTEEAKAADRQNAQILLGALVNVQDETARTAFFRFGDPAL